MANIVPPPPSHVDSNTLRSWHDVFKTGWHELVAINYVKGAVARMYTENVVGLVINDGTVAFFGEDFLEPEEQPSLATVNVEFFATSSSASDTDVLRCWMVDEDGDETIMDVTLTGLTPVSIGNFVHCNMSMYLNGVGQNVGHLTVSTKAIAGVPLIITDKVQTHVGVTRGHGNNPRQLCPNDQVFVFSAIDISSDKADGVDVHLHVGRKFNGDGGPHEMRAKQWLIFQTVLNEEFSVPVAIAAGEYIELMLTRSAGSNGAVTAALNLDFHILAAIADDSPGGTGTLFG